MRQVGCVRFDATAALLCLIVLIAAALRLHGLESMSICHPEMYVPGIPMPQDVAEPQPRLTVIKTLTGTFSSDTHPPAYYLMMLGWTKLFGTSAAAIRLPSALLGIASVPLLFWLGALIGSPRAGLFASAMLAVSGLHVFWSKVARMYSPDCFMGLLSSVLLLLIVRGARRQSLLEMAYAATVLLGLASHVFFWPIFVTQMAWVLMNSRGGPLPAILRIQMLVFVLGTPLLAFAAYQRGNPLAVMQARSVPFARDYLSFGFLFPNEHVTDLFRRTGTPAPALFAVAGAGALFLAAVLAAGALRRGRPMPIKPPTGRIWPKRVWMAAGALAFSAIWVFVAFALALNSSRLHPTLISTELTSVVPLIVAAVAIAVDRSWQPLPTWGSAVGRVFLGPRALVAMLAFVPFLTVAALSLLKPMLNQRGLVLFVPYVLLVLAIGLASMSRRRWAAALIVTALVPLHIFSLQAYAARAIDPTDFRSFSAALARRVQPGDMIFMRHSWNASPILFYLKGDRYDFVGKNYGDASNRSANGRIWALAVGTTQLDPEIAQAVGRYHLQDSIGVDRAHAWLYVRQSGGR